MRMWLVNPKTLCRNHLLGEHVELHMLAGTLWKGRSIAGWLNLGQVDPSEALWRHQELADEMQARGYSHCSPLDWNADWDRQAGHVDPVSNHNELARRCERCAARQRQVTAPQVP